MTRTTLISIAVLASVIAAVPAQARDQGIINQTGTYERSMAIYLHPAGYFFESGNVAVATVRNMDHPAVAARMATVDGQNHAWGHPALRNGVSRGMIAAHQ